MSRLNFLDNRFRRAACLLLALVTGCLCAPPSIAQISSFSHAAPRVSFLDLTVVSATAAHGKWTAPGPSGPACLLFAGKTVGDQITFSFPARQSGTYYLGVYGYAYPDSGTYDLLLDGAVVGNVDFSGNGVATFNALPLTAGDHALTYRLTGKRDKSRGMNARPLWLDMEMLTPARQDVAVGERGAAKYAKQREPRELKAHDRLPGEW